MKKVLVVDDDEAIQEAIQISLELDDYFVCTASDGPGAIKTALTEIPDMIILDVLLSGDDGRNVARQLRNHASTKHIPIVMVSAHPNIKQTVIDAGADNFLPKPFDMDDLLSLAAKYTARTK